MRWLPWMLLVVLPTGPVVRADEPAPDAEAAAADTPAEEADDEADLRDDSRLLLSPTGRPLRQGSGYLSDHYILLPGFSVGLTDNVSLSAGMSVLPGVGDDGQFIYVSPRIGKRFSERLAVSAGFFYARIPPYFADDPGAKHLRLAYAVATVGGAASSLTAGVYAGSGAAGPPVTWAGGRPTVMLGGARRLAPGFVVVSENWLMPYEGLHLLVTPALALRLSKGRFSTDLGFMRYLGGSLRPWFSISYHLGRVRRE